MIASRMAHADKAGARRVGSKRRARRVNSKYISRDKVARHFPQPDPLSAIPLDVKFRDFFGIGLSASSRSARRSSGSRRPVSRIPRRRPARDVLPRLSGTIRGRFLRRIRRRRPPAFRIGLRLRRSDLNFWSRPFRRRARRAGRDTDRPQGRQLSGRLCLHRRDGAERPLGAHAGRTDRLDAGPVRTSEDEFGLQTLANYAAFLKTSPGGRFPVLAGTRPLLQSETPTSGDAAIRKGERRVCLRSNMSDGASMPIRFYFATWRFGADKARPGRIVSWSPCWRQPTGTSKAGIAADFLHAAAGAAGMAAGGTG